MLVSTPLSPDVPTKSISGHCQMSLVGDRERNGKITLVGNHCSSETNLLRLPCICHSTYIWVFVHVPASRDASLFPSSLLENTWSSFYQDFLSWEAFPYFPFLPESPQSLCIALPCFDRDGDVRVVSAYVSLLNSLGSRTSIYSSLCPLWLEEYLAPSKHSTGQDSHSQQQTMG